MASLSSLEPEIDSAPPRAGQADSILELRSLLGRQFPNLRQGIAAKRARETIATGVEALDELLGGGLPRAEITELVAPKNGSGSAEVIHAFLRHISATRQFLVLVDGAGSFDPGALTAAVLSRLLWVRCRETRDALKALDLLLRDCNVALVVLDLQLNPARELRKISSSIWFRYARLIEQNSATVLVITPQALVSVAPFRLRLQSQLGLESLTASERERLAHLRFQMLRGAVEQSDLLAQAG